MLMDFAQFKKEIRIRLELVRTNPKLLAQIDAESARKNENCLALPITEGTIRKSSDGSLRIQHHK